MKFAIALSVVSAAALAASAPAEARQGCGAGFNRAPSGRCVPNRGQQQRWVVGRYYAGHGYWYNNRWWRTRYRHQNGWRYR
jgi:hypothetical protein